MGPPRGNARAAKNLKRTRKKNDIPPPRGNASAANISREHGLKQHSTAAWRCQSRRNLKRTRPKTTSHRRVAMPAPPKSQENRAENENPPPRSNAGAAQISR